MVLLEVKKKKKKKKNWFHVCDLPARKEDPTINTFKYLAVLRLVRSASESEKNWIERGGVEGQW